MVRALEASTPGLLPPSALSLLYLAGISLAEQGELQERLTRDDLLTSPNSFDFSGFDEICLETILCLKCTQYNWTRDLELSEGLRSSSPLPLPSLSLSLPPCSPGWPSTHRDSPASVSRVLGLKE